MAREMPRPYYVKIDGILFPPFKPERIREALSYQPKPDDVFVATYPKCGTTWMQSIALYIFRKGKELENHDDFHTLTPFIEDRGLRGIEKMPRPGPLKTHIPFTRVPYSPSAKYIYVLRNPKDCCVSLYHHTKGAHHDVYSEATFDDFFEIFMAGEVEYNDYFDHLMSWYPHRNDKNVFFTTYEDMKKNDKDVVLKVAAFLGQEYLDNIQKDNNVLSNILRFSSFDYMKQHLNEAFTSNKIEGRPNSAEGERTEKPDKENKETVEEQDLVNRKRKLQHMRKGVVGDWKNLLSEEHSEKLNKKFIERLQGTEIFYMYRSYMGL